MEAECYDCKTTKEWWDTLHLKGVEYPLCKECSHKRIKKSKLRRRITNYKREL